MPRTKHVLVAHTFKRKNRVINYNQTTWELIIVVVDIFLKNVKTGIWGYTEKGELTKQVRYHHLNTRVLLAGQ